MGKGGKACGGGGYGPETAEAEAEAEVSACNGGEICRAGGGIGRATGVQNNLPY